MTSQYSSKESGLDPALSLRAARWEDLKAVAALTYITCAAEGDTSVAASEEDIEMDWKFEGFAPQEDAFVVETDGGVLVGYMALYDQKGHCELNGDYYCHPDYRVHGVTTALLRAAEARAQAHLQLAEAGQRVFLRVQTHNQDKTGKDSLSAEGYAAVRYHWRMGVELSAAPAPSALPAGLELRPFKREEQAVAVWQAHNEAFREHWGSHALTFEEFNYYFFDNPEYDPSLWKVAWHGQEVAGYAVNYFRMDIGWVGTLGVRAAWRGQGLGLALLQHSFAEFYARGMKAVGLGVDASNQTGATRLYRKAGMSVVSEFVTFDKELRPAG